jgi:hypothetical protein
MPAQLGISSAIPTSPLFVPQLRRKGNLNLSERKSPERHLCFHDGQDRLGMVIQRDSRCDAFDVQGVYFGTFKRIKATADAVTLARSNSEPGGGSG